MLHCLSSRNALFRIANKKTPRQVWSIWVFNLTAIVIECFWWDTVCHDAKARAGCPCQATEQKRALVSNLMPASNDRTSSKNRIPALHKSISLILAFGSERDFEILPRHESLSRRSAAQFESDPISKRHHLIGHDGLYGAYDSTPMPMIRPHEYGLWRELIQLTVNNWRMTDLMWGRIVVRQKSLYAGAINKLCCLSVYITEVLTMHGQLVSLRSLCASHKDGSWWCLGLLLLPSNNMSSTGLGCASGLSPFSLLEPISNGVRIGS